MLTHDRIVKAVEKVAKNYPVKSAAYFGSYADGRQTKDSDLDLLVEFEKDGNGLFTIIGFQQDIEVEVGVKVDVVPMPIPKQSIIEIEEAVHVYGEEKQNYSRKIVFRNAFDWEVS